MSYSIHPDAEAELGDAAVYYATHASKMIAAAFLAEYERVRDLLVENQQRGPHGDEGLRRSRVALGNRPQKLSRNRT